VNRSKKSHDRLSFLESFNVFGFGKNLNFFNHELASPSTMISLFSSNGPNIVTHGERQREQMTRKQTAGGAGGAAGAGGVQGTGDAYQLVLFLIPIVKQHHTKRKRQLQQQ